MNTLRMLLVLLTPLPIPAVAQVLLSGMHQEVAVDFDGFTAAGFAPTPAAGQLSSFTWRVEGLSDGTGLFSGTHDTGDFARGSSSGGESTGGVYAFAVAAGTTALGIQQTGDDMTPGEIGMRLRNDSALPITDLRVEFDLWVLNNEDRSSEIAFGHSSLDGGNVVISSLTEVTPADAAASPAWTRVGKSTTLTGISIAPGEMYDLAWLVDDAGGSGSRDEFGIASIRLEAVPEPSAIWLGLAALLVLACHLKARRRAP